MAYGVFGTFIAADGRRDELVEHLLRAARLLDGDGACLQYVVGGVGVDRVSVFEVWTDKAAHAASLERDDIRELIGTARPLVAGMGDRVEIVVHGGKGVTV